MKELLLITVSCILLSCKTEDKKQTNNLKTKMTIEKCVLEKLPKMLNYKNELERIAKISEDTTITVETIEHNGKTYKTVFELIPTEYKVWLLKQDVKIDSIQLHYQDFVEYFYTTNSTFDIDNCTIIQTTVSETTPLETVKFKL